MPRLYYPFHPFIVFQSPPRYSNIPPIALIEFPIIWNQLQGIMLKLLWFSKENLLLAFLTSSEAGEDKRVKKAWINKRSKEKFFITWKRGGMGDWFSYRISLLGVVRKLGEWNFKSFNEINWKLTFQIWKLIN